MTVVAAVNYLTEIIVVADTRVSYLDWGNYDAGHGLRKLMPIVSPDNTTVAMLGFAGDVGVAKKIFRHLLITKRLYNYQRGFIIPQLQQDIARWIEELIEDKSFSIPRQVQLLFCALEPKTPVLLREKTGKLVRSPIMNPLKESYMYVYTVTTNKTVVIQRESSGAVIGSGKTEQFEKIIEAQEKFINFGRGYPEHNKNRAWLVGREIADAFEEAGSRTVGGPFEIIRIAPPPDNSIHLWHWWPGGIHKPQPSLKIQEMADGTTILTNQTENKTVTIFPIWHGENWKPSNNLK